MLYNNKNIYATVKIKTNHDQNKVSIELDSEPVYGITGNYDIITPEEAIARLREGRYVDMVNDRRDFDNLPITGAYITYERDISDSTFRPLYALQLDSGFCIFVDAVHDKWLEPMPQE